MKVIYSTKDVVEAKMLEDALQERNIAMVVSGERANQQLGEPVSILVSKDRLAEARRVIEEFLQEESVSQKSGPPQEGGRSPTSSRFFPGLLVGAALAYALLFLQHRPADEVELPAALDSNGDGVDDRWFEYEDGDLVKESEDLNSDGAPDRGPP